MHFDEKLLTVNKEAELVSVYVAADEIERTLSVNADQCASIARFIHTHNPEELILVGSGASYASLYAGHYFMRVASALPTTLAFGPELVGDDPAGLRSRRAVAIMASYGGRTVDTLEAADYLSGLRIPRIAITRDENSLLAANCDHVISYGSKCLFTSAMANLLLLLAELLLLRGEQSAAIEMKEALRRLPDQIRTVISKGEREALAALERVCDEELFYVLGDGALWGLAYQYGYTNLTEYARVHAACLRSCEWRHGTLELLFRRPAVIMLLGNDGSRPYAEATRDYCVDRGAKVTVFDVRDYFETLPTLAPFVLHPVSQFFLLYLCTHLGVNMDEYLEMHVRPYRKGEAHF